jgi:hypothetical protein
MSPTGQCCGALRIDVNLLSVARHELHQAGNPHSTCNHRTFAASYGHAASMQSHTSANKARPGWRRRCPGGQRCTLCEDEELDRAAPLLRRQDPLLVRRVVLLKKGLVERDQVCGDCGGNDTPQFRGDTAAALHVIAHGVEEAAVVCVHYSADNAAARGRRSGGGTSMHTSICWCNMSGSWHV